LAHPSSECAASEMTPSDSANATLTNETDRSTLMTFSQDESAERE
jgi:hypothetical protein